MAEALHGWRAVQGMRSRPARLAELVRRAQGQASKSRPIALDAALLGGPSVEPDTVHVAAKADPPPRRWPIWAVLVGTVASLGAWAAWSVGSEPQAVPTPAPSQAIAARQPDPPAKAAEAEPPA